MSHRRWGLKITALAQAGLDGGFDGFPFASTLRKWAVQERSVWGGLREGALVDHQFGIAIDFERAVAGLEGEGESVDVLVVI